MAWCRKLPGFLTGFLVDTSEISTSHTKLSGFKSDVTLIRSGTASFRLDDFTLLWLGSISLFIVIFVTPLSLLILLVILIDSLLDLIWLVEFKTWPLLLDGLILLVGFGTWLGDILSSPLELSLEGLELEYLILGWGICFLIFLIFSFRNLDVISKDFILSPVNAEPVEQNKIFDTKKSRMYPMSFNNTSW